MGAGLFGASVAARFMRVRQATHPILTSRIVGTTPSLRWPRSRRNILLSSARKSGWFRPSRDSGQIIFYVPMYARMRLGREKTRARPTRDAVK